MYIAVDIGGTNGRAALFRGYEQMPEPIGQIKFPIQNRYEVDLRKLVSSIKRILPPGVGSGPEPEDVQGMSVAVAGRIDLDQMPRRIVSAGNLSDWVDKDFRDDLMSYYSWPISILNDAQAGGLGEAQYGLKPLDDFWFVIWGTGIGGSLVRRSLLPHGYTSYQSELGHMLADTRLGAGVACTCGQLDCLEAHAGGKAIENLYKVPADQLDEEAWGEVTTVVAEGIRNLLVTQPTRLVVFGGGVALNQEARLTQIYENLRGILRSADLPDFEITKLGDDAGVYGSLARAMR